LNYDIYERIVEPKKLSYYFFTDSLFEEKEEELFVLSYWLEKLLSKEASFDSKLKL
jgi:hypothetical protein